MIYTSSDKKLLLGTLNTKIINICKQFEYTVLSLDAYFMVGKNGWIVECVCQSITNVKKPFLSEIIQNNKDVEKFAIHIREKITPRRGKPKFWDSWK